MEALPSPSDSPTRIEIWVGQIPEYALQGLANPSRFGFFPLNGYATGQTIGYLRSCHTCGAAQTGEPLEGALMIKPPIKRLCVVKG